MTLAPACLCLGSPVTPGLAPRTQFILNVQFPERAEHFPDSGLLYILFPLPRMLFPGFSSVSGSSSFLALSLPDLLIINIITFTLLFFIMATCPFFHGISWKLIVYHYVFINVYLHIFFWSFSPDSMFCERRDHVCFFITWDRLALDKYVLNRWDELHFV